MKRRDFIKTVAPAAVVPFFSNKLFAAAYPPSVLNTEALTMLGPETDRVLVIINLIGGNDGLNTLFPMDQYANLMNARTNILMPDTAPLVLSGTQIGMHPNLTGLKSLFDEHKLSIVQNVAYSSQNYSHFRSSDIWTSGSDSASVVASGWVGRYLQYAFPGYPSAYPSTAMPDPLAVQVGSNLSPGLQGYEISTGQTVPITFNGSITSLLGYNNTITPATSGGAKLSYIRNQQAYTNQYGSRLISAWNAGTNMATYAATSSSSIAQQLKVIARLIKGGLKTRVYWASVSGFDTHSNQVVSSDKKTGTHATLIGDLSNAIRAFQTDLNLMSLENRVIGMTYSEFGRRIKSNGALGTDHGSAAPMFIFGTKVNWGVIGSNPVIPTNAGIYDQVEMQFDFHKVYTDILQNWFCVPQSDAQTVLGDSATALSAINGCSTVLPVELMRFKAEKANQSDVHIEWTTTNENDVDKYDIERSTDGKKFAKIGEVKAVGHTHEPTRYDYLDKNLVLTNKTTIFYYRLSTKDLDGTIRLTEIKSVIFDKAGKSLAVDVFPNPSHGKCQLIVSVRTPSERGGVDESAMTEITVNDMYGRPIQQFYENLKQDMVFDLDLNKGKTAAGVYFVSVKNGTALLVRKIVVQ